MMALLPLARTAMDQKSGRAMQGYTKKVEQMLNAAIPWQKRATGRAASLRGKIKPGEVVVILEGGDTANDPLFADARTIRE